jgi:hypothetical protein
VFVPIFCLHPLYLSLPRSPVGSPGPHHLRIAVSLSVLLEMESSLNRRDRVVPMNSVLHCDAYPDVDVAMTNQQKMKYERHVVSVAREMIENRHSHARDALESIQEELTREIHLTVPTDLLYSNLKNVCSRPSHNIFLISSDYPPLREQQLPGTRQM